MGKSNIETCLFIVLNMLCTQKEGASAKHVAF